MVAPILSRHRLFLKHMVTSRAQIIGDVQRFQAFPDPAERPPPLTVGQMEVSGIHTYCQPWSAPA